MMSLSVAVFVVAVMLAAVDQSQAYPNGPPVGWANDTVGVCVDMVPEHGYPKQTTPPPFTVTFHATCFSPGDSIKVMIGNSSLEYYEGFFVQVKKPGDHAHNFGTFSTDGNSQIKTQPCFGHEHSAISHAEKHHYWEHSMSWTAPNNELDHDVQLVATIVHETEKFWVDVKSDVLMRCHTGGSQAVTAHVMLVALAIAALKML